MADGIVNWHLFDAESGLVPEELSPSILSDDGRGRIIALAVTPFARTDGWADRAVIAVAKAWAHEDLRIFLMDLGLDSPSLHKTMGLLNREGVSDAFLYGASVQRIAQPALDDAIFFASAGTVTADPEQVLGHPRWNDLAGGFSEADATLLLFLPTDIAGADQILSRVTDVLFIAGEGESAEEHLGQASVKVAGRFGPEGSPTEESAEVHPGSESGDLGAGVSTEAEIPAEEILSATEDTSPREGPGEEDPVFDLDKGLSLAEGFALRADDAEEKEELDSDEAGGGEAPGDPQTGDDFYEVATPEGGSVLEDADPLSSGFADGDLIREGFEGGVEIGEGETGDIDISGQDVPDFGADFVEMPNLDGEETAVEGGGRLIDDITVGHEFDSDHFAGLTPETGTQGGQRAEGDADPSGEDVPPAAPERPRPMSKRRPPPKKLITPRRVAGGGALLALLVVAGGTAIGAFDVPGFMWLQELVYEVPPPELTLEGPQANEPILRFSLELETYEAEDLGVALEMRNTLRERLPDLLFSLTPLESEGVVSYVLHAGPAVDVVDADNLRGPLGETLTREDPESWPIRSTPRGFYLGERGTLAEAEDYLDVLEADGALGYIVHLTYADGSEAYEVLSGAFQQVEDARWWQLALRRYGFRDLPLIERRGRSPE